MLPVALFIAFSIWMWASLSAADRSLKQDVQKNSELALLAKDMQRHVIPVQQFLTDVSATRGQDGFAVAAEHRTEFNLILETFEKAQAAGTIELEANQLACATILKPIPPPGSPWPRPMSKGGHPRATR